VRIDLDETAARGQPCGVNGLFHSLPERGEDQIRGRGRERISVHNLLRCQRPEPENDCRLWQPALQPPDQVARIGEAAESLPTLRGATVSKSRRVISERAQLSERFYAVPLVQLSRDPLHDAIFLPSMPVGLTIMRPVTRN
jgi:hypothetical protein